MHATFLLWLVSELFEQLPEAGDADKPQRVFFFGEAHWLFNDAPKVLVDKIEQAVAKTAVCSIVSTISSTVGR